MALIRMARGPAANRSKEGSIPSGASKFHTSCYAEGMDALGTHLLLEYWCCDSGALATPKRIEDAMLEAAREVGSEVIKSFFFKLDSEDDVESGVVGSVIMAGASMMVRTSPESYQASVDVFVVDDHGNPSRADRVLRRAFKSGPSNSLTVTRGIAPMAGMKVKI